MKCLIIQLAKIGDILQSSSLVKEVSEKFDEIYFLHDKSFSSVVDKLQITKKIMVNLDKWAKKKAKVSF